MDEIALQVFSHEEFGEVRTIGDWENPLFCLVDVCRVLDLRVDNVATSLKGDPYTAGGISLHPITDSLGRTQMVNFVDEPCLYRIIFTSRKPNALKFQDWIFRTVIPSIRKTGTYSMANTPRSFFAPNDKLRTKDVPELLPCDLKLTDEERKLVEKEGLPNVSPEVGAVIEKLLQNIQQIEAAAYLVPVDLPGEVWKNIKGYEGLYQVSNKARVKSFQFGRITILKPKIGYRGYYQVCLSKNGRVKYQGLHRLVAKTFIPNPEHKPEVDHKDKNPAHNWVENLRWVTSLENSENSEHLDGEKNHMAKLTNAIVTEIYLTHIPGDPEFGTKALAKKFGVATTTINRIIAGKAWRHITQNLIR